MHNSEKAEKTTKTGEKVPKRNPQKSTIKNVLSGTGLAKLIGVTKRRVEQLTADGIFKNLETTNGRAAQYDTEDSIKAYCNYLREKAAGKEKSSDVQQLSIQKLEADTKYRKAKAEKARIELKELKGQYLRASDVEDFTTDLIVCARSELLALPGKMGVILAECKDAQEITGVLQSEVDTILEDIAKHNYSPAAYAERLRERQGKEQMQRDEEDEEDEEF